MNELLFYQIVLIVWAAIAVVILPLLFLITAPYGRHSRSGWGPMIDARAGWVVMEAAAPLLFALFFVLGGRTDAVSWVFLFMWQSHYAYRAFVYPFRRRSGGTMPLSIALSGLLFNVINGYMQGRFLFSLGPAPSADWLSDPRFIVGCILFFAGLCIHVNADEVLRRLRKPGESGYKIPRGGLYGWVSSPNYFGEIVQWTGWALATWSAAGLVFAFWTVANLLPRARSHHRWYREQFADYPRERKALIPFVF